MHYVCDSYRSSLSCITSYSIFLSRRPVQWSRWYITVPHPGPLSSWTWSPCPVGRDWQKGCHLSFPYQPYPSLFPQVLGFTLIILCTSSVSVTLWRIQQGTPQALEFLIHPTVWLTTMVSPGPDLLACSRLLLLLPRWRAGAEGAPPPASSTPGPPATQPSCPELRRVPDPCREKEGRPGVGGALRVLATLLSLPSHQRRPAGLARGKWGPGSGNQSGGFRPWVPSVLLPLPSRLILSAETHTPQALKLKQHTQALHIDVLITPYLFINRNSYCLTHSSHTLHLHTLVCPHSHIGLPWWLRRSRICLQCRRPRFNPWVGKVPWRRKWQPTLVFLSGEFHQQRTLAGYSLWSCKELDTSEQLTLFTSLFSICVSHNHRLQNITYTHTHSPALTLAAIQLCMLSSSYRTCAQMSHTHTHTHTHTHALHGHRHTVGSKPQGFPGEIRNQLQIWRAKREQRNRPPLQLEGDDSHKQGNLWKMLVLAAAKYIDLRTCPPET